VIVVFFLGLGFLILLSPNGWDEFLFWELAIGIGGTYAIWEQENKEEREVKK